MSTFQGNEHRKKYQSISFSEAPYRKADRYKEKGKVFFMLSIAKRNSETLSLVQIETHRKNTRKNKHNMLVILRSFL